MKGLLLPLLILHRRPTQDEAPHRLHVAIDMTFSPSHLPVRMLGIADPMFHRSGEAFGPRWRDIFTMNLIAAFEQPIDPVDAAAARVHTDNRAFSEIFIK